MKMRLQRSCFPLNIAKFLRTPILKNIWKRLLLLVAVRYEVIFLEKMTAIHTFDNNLEDRSVDGLIKSHPPSTKARQ